SATTSGNTSATSTPTRRSKRRGSGHRGDPMSGRQTYSQAHPTASAGALAGLLVMASMATACGSPYGAASPQAGDPARSVAQQDGYTITLALVPLAELGLEPPAGA